MQPLRRRLLAATLPFLLCAPGVYAQQPSAPTRAEAAAALNPAATKFTGQQLDQLLAPIALYPDKLLTAILMAATFPEQIVDAGKWLADSSNAALKGDDLAAALQPLPWDPSVKSLVPFPQVIGMLNDHLDWTESLGIAFNNQQIDTMARVQYLRERAVTQGKLKSTPQLAVNGGSDGIVIEPVDPAMTYLPVYNPATAYGAWPDRDYPPVYIPPPPEYRTREIGPGFGVAIGFGVVGALWGWNHPDWRRHDVVVDRDRYTRITNTTQTTNNHITIENNTWRRTEPVATVPEAARPHRDRDAAAIPHPQGTVTPAVIVAPHREGDRNRPAATTTTAPATTTTTAPAATTTPKTEPAATTTATPAPKEKTTGAPPAGPATTATTPAGTPSMKEKAAGTTSAAPAGTATIKEAPVKGVTSPAPGGAAVTGGPEHHEHEAPAHTGTSATGTASPATTAHPSGPAAVTATPVPHHEAPAKEVTPAAPVVVHTPPPPPPHPAPAVTATPPHPTPSVTGTPPTATAPKKEPPAKKPPAKPGEEDKPTEQH